MPAKRIFGLSPDNTFSNCLLINTDAFRLKHFPDTLPAAQEKAILCLIILTRPNPSYILQLK